MASIASMNIPFQVSYKYLGVILAVLPRKHMDQPYAKHWAGRSLYAKLGPISGKSGQISFKYGSCLCYSTAKVVYPFLKEGHGPEQRTPYDGYRAWNIAGTIATPRRVVWRSWW
jgi:hypothetical protein